MARGDSVIRNGAKKFRPTRSEWVFSFLEQGFSPAGKDAADGFRSDVERGISGRIRAGKSRKEKSGRKNGCERKKP